MKISRKELRAIIVEASAGDMSYDAGQYLPAVQRVHGMLSGLKGEFDRVQFGSADETGLIRREMEDALNALKNVLTTLNTVSDEHRDVGGMIGRLARGRPVGDISESES